MGHLGRWGYDSVGKVMMDPNMFIDMMSYCQPVWISDFHYMRIYQQVRGDNRFYAYSSGHDEVAPYRGLYVMPDGSTVWDTYLTTQMWAESGEPQALQITTSDGAKSSPTGYYFPYDHQSGGLLMVPETARALTVKAPALPAAVAVPR